jgi:glycerophosphoryl diester phosphodiesterase
VKLRNVVSSFRVTRDSFHSALRVWRPLLMSHFFIRLVSTAVLVPVIGVLLAGWLSFSNQAALTDQDIARFLLTPAGAVGGLVIISLGIAAMVLDVTVMTALLHQDRRRAVSALWAAADFTLVALPRLVHFAVALLQRVLFVVAPFLAVAGVIAFILLRDHDINYYLAQRPPAFLVAAGLIGLVAAAMCVCLVERLSGWALALHFTVLDAMPVRAAFEESRTAMQGFRRGLVAQLAWWFLLRVLLAAIVSAGAGAVVAEFSGIFGDRLHTLAIGLVVLGAAWVLANGVVNALANGTIAGLLDRQFKRAMSGQSAAAVPQTLGRRRRAPAHVFVAVIAIVSAASVASGGFLLQTIDPEQEVVVIAHRGAAGTRPENTMAAVVQAIEDGADWIEIDVQETADGVVVVAHDSDFMKSAGVPTKIWNVTQADLAAIDIGSWFDPAYADERTPLLRDVLAAAKGRARVLIELKYYGHDIALENRVIALVEEAGMADEIATMSLKYPAVQTMQRLRPDWRTGVLAATAIGNLAGLQGDFLAVNTHQVSTGLVARADAAGKDVYAWTVNDPATMSRMISLGVDGLITDFPAQAREVVADYKALPTASRLLLALGNRVGTTFDLGPQPEARP